MESPNLASKTQLKDEEDESSFSEAMNLSLSLLKPMVMQTASDLCVFEIIAKAGHGAKLSALEISSHFPSCKNPDAPAMLDRLLRLLASHRVLENSVEGGERVYGLAPVAKYFVPDEDGVSLGPFMDLINYRRYSNWFDLKGAILEGGTPFKKIYGTKFYENPKIDPIIGQMFNKAMISHTTIVMKKMLEVYNGFEDIKVLVDVGGGQGTSLRLITSKHPHIKGINFDLPSVIQHAPNYPCVEHVEGDMFQMVPQGDAIFMKWIMHNWDDEDCLRILKNCHKTIPKNGKVIIMDAILPKEVGTSATTKDTFNMDMLMMTQTLNGKERTKEEFIGLATQAGFDNVKFSCFVYNFWVIEFYK